MIFQNLPFTLVDLRLLFLLQGELREKDFDIKKQTNGKSYTVVRKQYIVYVTKSFMEIHLFWAGKGTCCIPEQGHYGPSISALSVTPYGNCCLSNSRVMSFLIISL